MNKMETKKQETSRNCSSVRLPLVYSPVYCATCRCF
ncbi:hypothetical protein T12_16904 [Trichinella patagoniensis]|uniref:Uncharacterized protein n=1 Tax=Trichinella patagoniensis TaxID=990121 RepID=A0A0V0YUY1_9BILA|nr:hypothetical protein T12_16904 [Trichinella patagoniensis]